MYNYNYTTVRTKEMTPFEKAVFHASRCEKKLEECKPSEDELRIIKESIYGSNDQDKIKEQRVNLKKRIEFEARLNLIVNLIVIDTDTHDEQRYCSVNDAVNIGETSVVKITQLLELGRLNMVDIRGVKVIDRQPHLEDHLRGNLVRVTEVANHIGREAGFLKVILKKRYPDKIYKIVNRVFIHKDFVEQLKEDLK